MKFSFGFNVPWSESSGPRSSSFSLEPPGGVLCIPSCDLRGLAYQQQLTEGKRLTVEQVGRYILFKQEGFDVVKVTE